MEPLTPHQAKVLRLVQDAIEADGYPPTRAEICRAMGFSSPNAAEKHLRTLERTGAIAIDGSHRGIRLMTDTGLPLIGRVAAGSPILAEANVQARYRVDPALFKPRADYLLKVRGLSMRDAGILDGDLLAVHATHEARSGQIVVARLHDEVTVKRYKRSGSHVQLLPENPDFKIIEVDPRRDALAIEGVAVGIIRSGRTL